MIERRPRRVSQPDKHYPNCPNCETDRWVRGSQATKTDWQCLDCGQQFDESEAASPVPWGGSDD